MKSFISVIIFVSSFSTAAIANVIYKFECTASSMQADGTISKLVFTEDVADLDGQHFDADAVSAVGNYSIIKSNNAYSTGRKAITLTAKVDMADLQSSYNGYSEDGATNITAKIYGVELSVFTRGSTSAFFGTCTERTETN